MIRISRLLLTTTVLCVLFTLAKDVPPGRIYLLDLPLWLFIATVVIGRMANSRDYTMRWGLVDTLMIIVFGAITVAFACSDNHRQSLIEYLDWIRILAVYFGARLVSGNGFAEPTWRRMVWLCVVVLLFVGTVQLVTGTSFGLIGDYFGSSHDQSVHANLSGFVRERRISGTTTNPIVFAVWVTFFSLVAMSSLLSRGQQARFLMLSGIAAMVVTATLSRGAIAAFGLSWLALVVIARKDFLTARTFVTGGVAIGLLVPAVYVAVERGAFVSTIDVLERRVKEQELLQEDSGRVRVIKMGMALLDDPKVLLVGTGPDNLTYSYTNQRAVARRISGTSASYQRSGIHNLWVKALVEYGIFGLIGFAFFWGAVMVCAIRLSRTAEMDGRVWGRASVAFFIPYLLVDSMVYESSISYHIMVPVVSVVALIVGMAQQDLARRYAVRSSPGTQPRLYSPPTPG